MVHGLYAKVDFGILIENDAVFQADGLRGELTQTGVGTGVVERRFLAVDKGLAIEIGGGLIVMPVMRLQVVAVAQFPAIAYIIGVGIDAPVIPAVAIGEGEHVFVAELMDALPIDALEGALVGALFIDIVVFFAGGFRPNPTSIFSLRYLTKSW